MDIVIKTKMVNISYFRLGTSNELKAYVIGFNTNKIIEAINRLAKVRG